MDKELAVRMLGLIEEMNVENLALKAILLTVNRGASIEKIDALVEGAMKDSKVRDTVRAQWLPLRQRLESDSSLEEALTQFVRIVPAPKELN